MVCLFLVDKISVRKFRFCTTFSSVFSYFRMIFFFDENSPRRLLGTPDRIPWSGGLTLKDDDLKFPQFKPKSLLTAFPGQSEATLDLLKKCLIWDPIYRISAKGGLEHRYFHVNTEKKT
eukprot:TRINITY_DN2278_c0_g1_i31.p1 TRINITY_DN2278_c0_g1~~TRINITY_DN2278_c0_g1_i31.p1  ORF type:complete len:119 (+),score=21.56 TRINITY_DN2278_c0_g1_i31:120-476(+)